MHFAPYNQCNIIGTCTLNALDISRRLHVLRGERLPFATKTSIDNNSLDGISSDIFETDFQPNLAVLGLGFASSSAIMWKTDVIIFTLILSRANAIPTQLVFEDVKLGHLFPQIILLLFLQHHECPLDCFLI